MLLALLPTWAANTIVIIVVLGLLAIPVTYMIRKKIKGQSIACACSCGAKFKNIKKRYERDKKREAKKAAKLAKKNESCCSK